MPRTSLLLCTLLLGACAIPNTIEALDDRNPPPEFGRPGWVRVTAGVGAWVGGIVGGVASIVALPITWPLSLLAEDGLGEQAGSEFLLWPALGGAAFGHCLLGAPADGIDFVLRRVWTGAGTEVENSYAVVPLPPVELPSRAAAGAAAR
ncbi:MAG: hypothetical protein JNL08_05640 [Planctomycetes bacterium]|nr:hypothetical protein [Planctomycetota bacterium]